MKRIRALVLVAFCAPIVFAGVSIAREAANVIDKQATVTGVNRPGDASFDKLTVRNGDSIVYAKYEPDKDDLVRCHPARFRPP